LTSVGRVLARELGWSYHDNDELVRRRTGRGVAELLAEQGERALRVAEEQALRDALAAPVPAVLTVAAGTAAAPTTRGLLGDTFVVWLRAEPSTLARRVGSASGRPWLHGDPETVLRRLDAARRGAFGRLADLVVDVDDLDVASIVAAIREKMGAWQT
jgi:shikimate kinase